MYKFTELKKPIFIFLGTLFVAIGVIGIFLPGLPTTTFLLIASFFYVRSSPKLYNWLINHKVLGKFISDYQKHKAISLKHKILSVTMMWFFIGISVIYFVEKDFISIILLSCGLIGTVIVLSIKTLPQQKD